MKKKNFILKDYIDLERIFLESNVFDINKIIIYLSINISLKR